MLMYWLNLALTIAAAILLLPAAVFCLECLAALLPARGKTDRVSGRRLRVAIIMPAHNEESGIEAALRSVQPQLMEGDRLLVVADNCDDNTANVARACGAEVIERTSENERGKGYALDFGLNHLVSDAPDVIVIMDSDCEAGPGMIQSLLWQVEKTDRPAQAIYLLSSPPDPKPRDAISALAFLVKNLVRPRGLSRAGLPCLLTGTGMAFPWATIRQMRLASGNIVEDLQLSIDLTLAGHAPMLCAEASVTGQLPRQKRAARIQRTRWEHGFMQTAIQQLPRLFFEGCRRLNYEALSTALDLSVPPLALLVMAMCSATLLALVAALFGAAWHIPIMLAAGQLAVLLCVVAAWARFGRSTIPGGVLLSIPSYVAGKVPIYFNFAFRRETRWIRTERDDDGAAEDELASPTGAERLPTILLQDVRFHRITQKQCVDHVIDELNQGRGGMLVTPNLDHLHRCRREPWFAQLVAESNVVVADGMPLVWASRLQRTPLPERVAGSDLISSVSAAAAEAGKSIFFLGGAPCSADAAAEVLVKKFPKLQVKGVHCPVMGFEYNPEALAEIIDVITAAQPDIIYVGLGSPKQERLIHELREWLPKAWWLGVGYSFSFLAGHGQRAPIWMQRAGLEWVHRLFSEPKRLAKRYLVDGVPFAMRLLSSSAVAGLTGSARLKAAARPKATSLVPRRQAIEASAAPSDQQIVSMVHQSFAAGFAKEMLRVPTSKSALTRTPLLRQPRSNALRAFVLLGGALRPTPFRAAINRSILDMPLEDGRRLLANWQQQAAELARIEGIGRLNLRVLVDRHSHAPAAAMPHEACHVSIKRDDAEYRGTGGVLRDLAEEYEDDDFILVANGAQVLTAPLAEMVSQLYATESDISFVAHEDGTPSGLMLVRCEALRMISAKTYVDMKEQALPAIAQRFKVTHIDHRRSTGMPLHSHKDYLAGLRWWNFNRLMQSGTHADVLRRSELSRPNYLSSFSIVEPGASVEPGACLHDSVVLRGAHVCSGAVAVRCVLCPGSYLGPGETAVDQLITATSRSRQRINLGLQTI